MAHYHFRRSSARSITLFSAGLTLSPVNPRKGDLAGHVEYDSVIQIKHN